MEKITGTIKVEFFTDGDEEGLNLECKQIDLEQLEMAILELMKLHDTKTREFRLI